MDAAPPSMYLTPSMVTGGNQPGIAQDARSASPTVAFGAPPVPPRTRPVARFCSPWIPCTRTDVGATNRQGGQEIRRAW